MKQFFDLLLLFLGIKTNMSRKQVQNIVGFAIVIPALLILCVIYPYFVVLLILAVAYYTGKDMPVEE